jgi:hypothetical protein
MKTTRKQNLSVAALVGALAFVSTAAYAADANAADTIVLRL